MKEDDEYFGNDADFDDLENQINQMSDEDDGFGSKSKPKPKQVTKPKKAADDDIDVDKLLAQLDKHGELVDSEDEKTKKVKIQQKQTPKEPQRQAAPKQEVQKVVSKPVQPPVEQSKPATKPKPNALPEDDILIEEENEYHEHMTIVSVTALNYELENYFPKVIDEKTIGEEDYRDLLESIKDEWQIYIDRVQANFESGKMTPEKYSVVVKMARGNQQDLLARAKQRGTTVNTIQRIQKRIELIDQELAELNGMGQQADEQPAPEQTGNAHTESVMHEEKNTKIKPVGEKPAVTTRTSDMQPASTTSKMKEYMIPVSNLEEMSNRINQYIYFCLYFKQNDLSLDNELMIQVKQAKELFKTPYAIKSSDYKKVMASLPVITGEMVVGMNLQQRQAKIDLKIEEIEASFETMKEFGCTKEEAMLTVDTLKYFKKIQVTQLVPYPVIETTELLKKVVPRFLEHVPDESIKLTLVKLSGAADHRVFFIKYTYEYGGVQLTGDSPYVLLA